MKKSQKQKMEHIYFRHEKIREQQEELVKDTYQVIKENKNLIAHAPTGLGKTDAVLSSAITQAVETGKNIFFATPKISQHEIALKVTKDLNEKYDLDVKAIDLVGKKHLCSDQNLKEAPSHEFYELCKKQKKKEKCPFYSYAVGYSPREKKKASKKMEKFLEWYGTGKTNEEVTQKIEKMDKPPCGYEAVIEAGKKSQITICDYFHVLNPYISKGLMQRLGKSIEDSILIIDEAHNAPDRIRNSLSIQIGSYSFKKAKKEAEILNEKELKNKLDRIKRKIEKESKKLDKKEEKLITKNKIPIPDKETKIELEKTGENYIEKTNRSKSSCLSIKKFYDKWTEEKESFIRIMKKWKSGKGVSIQYKCLDPSVFTKDIVNKTKSTIMMSGTMKPQKMYRDLIGLEKNQTKLREYKSPFPEENRKRIIVPSVTTKYSERNPEQYQNIAKKISEITVEIPGNTAVFFPSYKVMYKVQEYLKRKIDKPIIIQEKEYSPKEKKQALKRFKNHSKSKKGALLTAVCGGSYGEGIDLPGQQLMGAIIVGIPLKEPDLETKSLIDYYDHKYGKGWEYGYIFPAMTKSIQAAGRCIRNKRDRGVIAYLDNRYTWKNYSRGFPKKTDIEVTEEPGEIVRGFWNNRKN